MDNRRRKNPRWAENVNMMLATPPRARARIARRASRSSRLARMAIASRVNIFKRTTEAFGWTAALTGSGATVPNMINDGAAPNQLIITGNGSASQFVTASGVQFGGALQFMLNHVTNVSEITNLYDNYRIKAVTVNVIPGFNQSDVAGTAMCIPTMHYTIDQDDATVPVTRSTVLENSYARTQRMDKPFSITFKPRAQNVVNTTTGSAAAGMLPAKQWLDSASGNIAHYGLKFWIDEFPTVASGTISRPFVKFTVTYLIEAKNVV